MKNKKIKKGIWVISKWRKDWDSDTDVAFVRMAGDGFFIASLFIRYQKGYQKAGCVNDLSWDCQETLELRDVRRSMQWRPMTKEEIAEYCLPDKFDY